MKKSFILLSVLSMTLASFNTIRPADNIRNADAASERMANSVVSAFQHRSLQEYATLFPSVAAFHAIMEKNSAFYGDNLENAKEDFEMHYTTEVLPALNQSFKSVIAQGMKAGIDWSTIKMVRVDFDSLNQQTTPATITFSSNGKEYHLTFEKTLYLNGEWKVSQYLKLL